MIQLNPAEAKATIARLKLKPLYRRVSAENIAIWYLFAPNVMLKELIPRDGAVEYTLFNVGENQD
jgi:hypothetical protein